MSIKRLCLALLCAISLTLPALAQKKGGSNSVAASTSTSTAPSTGAAAPSSSAPIEEQVLAFRSLDLIAQYVAQRVCMRPDIAGKVERTDSNSPDPKDQTILIFDQASFANIGAFAAFQANAQVVFGAYKSLADEYPNGKNFENEIENLRKIRLTALTKLSANDAKAKAQADVRNRHYSIFAPITLAPVEPFSDATSFLSAVASASTSETAGSIVIPDSAAAVAITRELKKRDNGCIITPQIIYPPLFGPGSATDYSSAEIQTEIQDVDDARQIALTHADTAFKATLGMGDGRAANGDSIISSVVTDVNGLYDSFMNSLLQVNSSTGVIGSAAIVQGYQLYKLLSGYPLDTHEKPTKPKAFILLASILSAGGTEHDHKNFFRSLLPGDQLSYSAGVVVNVSLWRSGDAAAPLPTAENQISPDTGRAPIYSDVLRLRIPFTKFGTPRFLHSSDGVVMGENLGKNSGPSQTTTPSPTPTAPTSEPVIPPSSPPNP
jgi:hypothetical protein